ncbi:MAG: oxygen-dependent coproporphyrinogen oxidase [Deltaproteobacteria bacterium]|nr:oxygen-dependent coproporphyrinogen oxidase [Deltaproteobacteria bacterium]
MIPPAVIEYLRGLQAKLRAGFEALDPSVPFVVDPWSRPPSEGTTIVLDGGAVLERAGVGLSIFHGNALPESASARHPELVGRPFVAAGVSCVVHPRNPYVPTTHMNVRGFFSETKAGEAVWWFGGGFDLTPYFPIEADIRAWHRTAKAACDPFGALVYPTLKAACDEYFYLPHRKEHRGVGGLFFDDLNASSQTIGGDFQHCFSLMQSVGDHFLAAYRPIVIARKGTAYGDRERAFQLHRRGRYAEFNLVWDRGTKFGLQSGGRIESILLSMPPLAGWRYDWHPPEEAALLDALRPRDWIGDRSE